MDDIYSLKRDKKKELKKPKKNYTKPMVAIILTLLTLISVKRNPEYKKYLKKYVYESNLSFTKINETYKSFAGDLIPGITNKSKPVFSEKLEYSNSVKYLDGTKLSVKNNYLVPALESGLVVFIGEKEGYNNTVIIQQVNGIDLMYGNLGTISVKLYDYVEKGTLLGDTTNEDLYLVYKKEGKSLNYEEYIKN